MAYGQTWPTKPIRWIVPYTGGGLTDVVTRVITQKMQGPLGQPIVVDNRPGANSILGSDIAAKAAPDGYTMVTVIAGYAANVTLYAGKLPFDPRKDLVPVSLAAIAPLILTANPNFPAKDVRELVAYAKANPGKVNFGSSGIGAGAHLATELLKQTAAIDPFCAGKCVNSDERIHSMALVFVARPDTPVMLRCAASGPMRKSASR